MKKYFIMFILNKNLRPMKTLTLLLVILSIKSVQAAKNIYEFSLENIEGKLTSLSDYKGKVLLIANTASGCGYTPQYKDLEATYQKYKSQGLVVLGFPSNDFGGQEPGSNQEIKKFCDLKTGQYKISFPLFAKSNMNTNPKNPLFAFMIENSNTELKGQIDWNFEKFLINKKGELVSRFKSKIKPTDSEITNLIEKELK